MTPSDTHEKRAVDVVIAGEVDSRIFLLQCRYSADEYLLYGWAKPGSQSSAQALRAASTIELHLEGLGYQIDKFLEWLRGGVDGVRISRIQVEPALLEMWHDFELLD